MTTLFLHGWQSTPGGLKPTYLPQHGHEVLNPALPDDDFDAAVEIVQGEFDRHKPDVVVGSSRGGAVKGNRKSVTDYRTRAYWMQKPIYRLLVIGSLSWFFATKLEDAFSSRALASPIDAHWIEQKLAEWKTEGAHPVEIAGVLDTVSYGHVNEPAVTQRVIAANVKMLVEAGFSVIRIDLNYDPWLNHDDEGIKKYDAAVSLIRENGKKLMIADSAAESYRHKRKVSWQQFKTEWVQRVGVVAAKYKPDYYVVVKEPGWYWLMPLDALLIQPWGKPQEWIDLTQELIAAVKAVSPHTKVAIATPGHSLYHGHAQAGDTLLTYFKAATQMKGLDILGFDNYSATDFEDTANFLKQVGTGGKEFWLLEAWTQPAAKEKPELEPLDKAFIPVAVAFVEKFGGQGAAFFFTRYLASYGERPRTEQGLLDYYSSRTSVFGEMQRVSARR